MSMRNTTKAAMVSAGLALTIGWSAAPAANAAPAARPATTASVAAPAAAPTVAARARVTRDAKWERAVIKEINALRKKKKMKPLTTSPCFTKAVQPVASRSAAARRNSSWTKADKRRMATCTDNRHRIHSAIQWGRAGRSAHDWVARAAKVAGGFDAHSKLSGVAVYRDSKGGRWVAATQVYVTKG